MEGDMGISINNLEARRTIALRTVLSNILSISHTVETCRDNRRPTQLLLLAMKPRSSYSKNRTVDFIKNTKAGIPSQLQHYPFGVSDSVPDPVPNPQPTVFFHDSYEAFDQYPQGVADIVGAESRLFGGAVLFDRGEGDADVCLLLGISHQGSLALYSTVLLSLAIDAKTNLLSAKMFSFIHLGRADFANASPLDMESSPLPFKA